MVDVARLSIRVDSQGTQQASRDLQELARAGQLAERSIQGFSSSAERSSRSTQSLNTQATAIQQALNGAARSTTAFSNSLDGVNTGVRAGGRELSQASNAIRRISEESSQAATETRRLSTEVRRNGQAASSASDDVTRLSRSIDSASFSSDVLSTAIQGLIAALSVQQIAQFADTWTNVQNQLRLVTESTEQLGDVTESLLSVSNETRSSLESTSNLYARLARSTTELNLSQSDLIGIVTTINQSFAISGATAEEAAAAITQLSQGLAAGALRGDEFNSVAESSPLILRAISDSLGLTIGELREFAATGGITAEIVVNALQGAAQTINDDFSTSIATLGQSLQVAQNNLLAFIGSSNEIQSISSSLGSTIVDLSENLDSLATASGALAAVLTGRLIGGLFESAAAKAQGVTQSIALARAEQVAAAAALEEATANANSTTQLVRQAEARVAASRAGSLNIATNTSLATSQARLAEVTALNTAAQNALTAAQTRYTVAAGAATVASRGLTSALALLGGPVGLLVTVAAGYALYRASSTEATTSTEQFTNAVNTNISTLRTLRGEQRELAIEQIQGAIAANEQQLASLETDRIAFTQRVQLLAEQRNQYAQTEQAVTSYNLAIANLAQSQADNADAQESIREVIADLEDRLAALQDQADSNTGSNIAFTASTTSQISATERFIENLRNQIATFGLSRAETIRYQGALRQLEAATEEEAAEIAVLTEELATLVENQEAAAESTRRFEEAKREDARATEQYRRENERAFESLSDGITDAIIDFENLGSTVENVFRSITRSILQSGVNSLLTSIGIPGGPSGGGFNPLSLISGANSLSNFSLSGVTELFGGGIGSGFNAFATSGIGQSLGLSQPISGAALQSQFGLSTGVAGGGTVLTPTGTALQGISQIAGPLAIIGASLSILSAAFRDIPVITFGQLDSPDSVIERQRDVQIFDEADNLRETRRIIDRAGFDFSVSTAFGEFGALSEFFTEDFPEEATQAFLDVVQALDEQIAGVLTDGEIARVRDQLSETFIGEDQLRGIQGDDAQEVGTALNQIISRYQEIFSIALPDLFQEAFTEFDGTLDEFFAQASTLFNALNVAQDELGISVDDLAASYENLAREGETLTDTMSRVVVNTAAATTALDLVGIGTEYAGEQLLQLSTGLVESAGSVENLIALTTRFSQAFGTSNLLDQTRVLSDQFREIGFTLPQTANGFRDLVQGLDLTSESGQEAFTSLLSLTDATVAYFGQLDQITQATNGLIDLSTSIRESLLSEEELYNLRREQAEELSDSLGLLTDPAEIASNVQEIESLVRDALGTLDESQRDALGEEIATYLDEVAAIANQRIQQLTQEAAGAGGTIQEAQVESGTNMLTASAEFLSGVTDFRSGVDAMNENISNLAAALQQGGFINQEVTFGDA